MACAIRGAYDGYQSIPSKLIEQIDTANMINLLSYANQLHEARGGLS